MKEYNQYDLSGEGVGEL